MNPGSECLRMVRQGVEGEGYKGIQAKMKAMELPEDREQVKRLTGYSHIQKAISLILLIGKLSAYRLGIIHPI